MTYSPLKDKKFITLLVDVIAFLVLYFAGKYAAPTIAADVQTVFATLQPLILLWVASEFQAENEDMKRGFLPKKFHSKERL